MYDLMWFDTYIHKTIIIYEIMRMFICPQSFLALYIRILDTFWSY